MISLAVMLLHSVNEIPLQPLQTYEVMLHSTGSFHINLYELVKYMNEFPAQRADLILGIQTQIIMSRIYYHASLPSCVTLFLCMQFYHIRGVHLAREFSQWSMEDWTAEEQSHLFSNVLLVRAL